MEGKRRLSFNLTRRGAVAARTYLGDRRSVKHLSARVQRRDFVDS